jgi:hypothetical protein
MAAPQPQRAKAVTINSDGAMNSEGEPCHITTEVHRNHVAFQQPISPLSRLLKLPIRLMRLPTGHIDTPGGPEHVRYKTNQHAQSLMPQLDGFENFCPLPAEWHSPPGSALAVAAG